MLKFYNRETKKYEIEKVAGEFYIKWIYSSQIGMNFLEYIIKRKLTSKICGYYCDRFISTRKIKKFINEFNIDMSQFAIPKNGYKSFNEFFCRKLKSGNNQREYDKKIFISPCDGKILAYEDININKLIQIKGITYSLRELIGDDSIAFDYENGICIVFRLSPSDYHRFHFVDNGICSKTRKIKGTYYSVNPIALNKISKLFCLNKREWSVLHCENFGNILYVEVGATFVGSIIQTYDCNKAVKKGDEKGYFKFGGSTVILFIKKGIIKIDEDIIQQTSKGIECNIKMGERIGSTYVLSDNDLELSKKNRWS